MVIEAGQVKNLRTGESVALPAHAEVDSAGELSKRFTATRLALFGPFALAMKKSKDKRQLFLAIEGANGGFLVEIDPKRQAEARRFTVITLASK